MSGKITLTFTVLIGVQFQAAFGIVVEWGSEPDTFGDNGTINVIGSGAAINLAAGSEEIGTVTVAPGASVTLAPGTAQIGSVEITSGTLAVSGTVGITGPVTIAAGSATIGAVNLAPGGTVTLEAGTASIGSVNIEPGAAVALAAGSQAIGTVAIAAGAAIALGPGSNAIGTVTIAAGATVTLNAGSAQIGKVVVSSGTLTIGAGTAAIGTVVVSAGTVTIGAGSATIGTIQIAAGASVALAAGSQAIGTVAIAAGAAVALAPGSSAIGTVNVGGGVTLNAGTAQIGTVAIAAGAAVALGPGSSAIGTVNIASGSSISIAAGTATIGTVAIAAGAAVALAAGSSAIGTVTISGGTLNINGPVTVENVTNTSLATSFAETLLYTVPANTNNIIVTLPTNTQELHIIVPAGVPTGYTPNVTGNSSNYNYQNTVFPISSTYFVVNVDEALDSTVKISWPTPALPSTQWYILASIGISLINAVVGDTTVNGAINPNLVSQVGGTDGTYLRALATDTSGRLLEAPATATATSTAAFAGNPGTVYMGPTTAHTALWASLALTIFSATTVGGIMIVSIIDTTSGNTLLALPISIPATLPTGGIQVSISAAVSFLSAANASGIYSIVTTLASGSAPTASTSRAVAIVGYR
jgi:hypothetical protein